MKCYPVIIPTLNRFKHLKDCVESLAKCKYADQTELIIGLDYPTKESHIDGYNLIRAYLPEIKGFLKVTIFERKENFGARKNIRDLAAYAFRSNDAVILTEDDNIFAYTALEFLNSSLLYFKDDANITSICAYTPSNQYVVTVDYLKSFDSSGWGLALWRDKDPVREINQLDYVKSILSSCKKSLKIFLTYPACLGMLIEMIKKEDIYGDTIRTSYNIITGKYQIKPSVSLVRNLGQDGSGLHSGGNNKAYEDQNLSTREEYFINRFSQSCVCKRIKLIFHSLSSFYPKALGSIFLIGMRYLKYRLSYKH